MPSFDIISSFDMQEIDNAVNAVKRDITTRYDLKGTQAKIYLNKKEKFITMYADNEMHIVAIRDMFQNRSVKRKISLKTFNFKEQENASGMKIRQNIELREGISKENATKINKLIKKMKLKVQSQIQGDQLRVTAKKIDDLQFIISALKKSNLKIPLNFVNFKN